MVDAARGTPRYATDDRHVFPPPRRTLGPLVSLGFQRIHARPLWRAGSALASDEGTPSIEDAAPTEDTPSGGGAALGGGIPSGGSIPTGEAPPTAVPSAYESASYAGSAR